MEFDNVGSHCQVLGCGQKDFLPFKCDCCAKMFCLEHRLYERHNCNGNGPRNMTSIACPICEKSIKFDAAQDVNLIWDDHFINVCTQKPTDVKTTTKRKCYKRTCTSVLGPSNTFNCPKCLQSVCLSHRIAEEHDCSSLVSSKPTSRSAFLDRVEKGAKTAAVSMVNQATKNPAKKRSSGGEQGDPVRDTAARRMQQQTSGGSGMAPATNGEVGSRTQQPTANADSAPLACPFCDFIEFAGDSAQLVAHVNALHGAGINRNNSMSNRYVANGAEHGSNETTQSVASTAVGREVCPACQARFADPVDLVAHFESAHGKVSVASRGAGVEKSDCSLS